MMSFLIFQRVKSQLKKENIVLKEKLFFDFENRKIIIDNKPISLQLIDIQKFIKTYEQLKDVITVELTASKIIITYKDGTSTTF